jgi:hypothetical protein
MIAELVDFIINVFIKIFQAVFIGAWVILAFMVVTVLGYHLINAIKSFF